VCADKAYSDKAREQIKKLMDYDETKELFEGNEASSSIANSFVLPDIR